MSLGMCTHTYHFGSSAPALLSHLCGSLLLHEWQESTRGRRRCVDLSVLVSEFWLNWVGLDPAYCSPLPRELVRGSYGPPTWVSSWEFILWVNCCPASIRPRLRELERICYGTLTRVQWHNGSPCGHFQVLSHRHGQP